MLYNLHYDMDASWRVSFSFLMQQVFSIAIHGVPSDLLS